jgi:hypothetical protein
VYQNIEVINNFFSQKNDRLLLINKINDEIGIFYINIINHFAQKNNIKINFVNDLKETTINNDLFDLTRIYILNLSNKKTLEQLMDNDNQVIAFTDYKIFKQYQSKVRSINGYDYIKDIKYFFREILNINNKTLIENIINNPELSYSEISKYLVSDVGYIKNISLHDDTNFILEIRKDIFKLRKTNDIKNIYFKIKDEAKYKKFSFLAY